MTLKKRTEQRQARIEVNRARSFREAEDWDLEYWQRRSPEERLSALVAIHRDVDLATRAQHPHGTAEAE